MAASPAGSSTPDVSTRSRIIERIERDSGVPRLADILSDRIGPTDLQSLLLEVYARRAKKRNPRVLLDDHVSNRFTRPSASDPTRLLEWDQVAFSKLPKLFRRVELSPVCPLGTASVLSPISQDWIVSTTRNSELSPTRQMCSLWNVRFDGASRRTAPRIVHLQYILQRVIAF